MNRVQGRLLNATAALALVAGILSGCAIPAAELNPATAGKLQERVNALARSAADKDFPAATKALDLLTNGLADAAARGEVSASRRQDIQNAIDLVRADLSTATPAATPGAPAPTQSPSVEPPAPVAPAPGRHKGNSKGNDG